MIFIRTRRGRETRDLALSSKSSMTDLGHDKFFCDVDGWHKNGLSSSWLLLGDVLLLFLGSAITVNDLLDLVIIAPTHTKCQPLWSLDSNCFLSWHLCWSIRCVVSSLTPYLGWFSVQFVLKRKLLQLLHTADWTRTKVVLARHGPCPDTLYLTSVFVSGWPL